MSVPLRSCVGCGKKAPQPELVRFVASEGNLAPGARRPGRGAYTCRRVECFELASARRGFSRALRTDIRVLPALKRLYTDEVNG